MQPVREVLHPKVLLGVSLPQSPRRSTPVRLQRATNKSLRVRGVRTHDERAGSPLSPSQRETPLQSGVAQILR